MSEGWGLIHVWPVDRPNLTMCGLVTPIEPPKPAADAPAGMCLRCKRLADELCHTTGVVASLGSLASDAKPAVSEGQESS